MLDVENVSLPLLIGALVGFVTIMGVAIIYVSKKERQSEKEEEEEEEVDIVMEDVTEMVTSNEPPKKNKHQRKNDQWKAKDAVFSHPWNVTVLKGHTKEVTDIAFASDGKKFVSISGDRNVILWDVRDFEGKEHKSIRQTIDYDTPTRVVFAPDCKSVVFSMKRENKLCVYKLAKKTEGNGSHHFVHIENLQFERAHQVDIQSVGIAGNAKYLMSSALDNKICLYDLRGQLLKSIDGKVSSLHDCRLSPDGRFVIVSGFTPDVFVFEPVFSRDGAFQSAKKVFSLSGHQSGVLAAAFNATATRAITVSRDGHWRVFDTEIRYEAGQDAKILREGRWEPLRGATSEHVRLEVSPSGDSFAVSFKTDLKVFCSEDETKDYPELKDICSSTISSIAYSSDGKYIATCGDKYIRIIRNVPEWHSRMVKLTRELPECTQDGARRRIKEQIEEAQELLKEYDI
uniref:WD_REPEATS_REGION domain-containing protein n=1 Tax=Caenorhabditis japonica TaxID=281687 RepID=A0A8R1HPK7_CAEJA